MNKMNLQKICLMALFSLLFVATGCKDYKDDVNRLDNEVEALKGNLDKMKSELTTKINEAGSSVEGAIDKKINALNIDEKIMAKLDAYDGTIDGKIDAKLAKYDKMIDGKIDAKLDAIDGKIDGKINVKLADYVKAQELEAYKAEMKKELDGLKEKVEQAADASELESYKTLVNDKFSEIDSKLEALGVKFELLSRRLSSLVAVTDFYVNGVQTWNFAPLRSKCFTVVPNMVAKYHLNPSTVTLKDIDVDKIKFNIIKAKETTLRSEEMPTINIDKEAISIKDGVLCIPLSIPDVEKFSTSGTFYKFAIQVPIADKYLHEEGKEMSDPFITSDYVRIASDQMVAGVDMFLALKGVDNKAIKDTKLATTVAAAEAENVNGIDSKESDDPRIINLPYGEKISLKDKIIAVMSDYSKFDTEMYGLEYKFDLKDAKTENDIEYLRGGNKTDQQKFINLDKETGTISAKTFDKAAIDAAQGRTPIVHVYVVNPTKPECHILDAYVKIHILDKPLPKAIVTKEYDFGDVTVKCDNRFLDTITVKYMNTEVYTATKLSKTEFHDVYKTYMLMPKVNGGYVQEVKNPDDKKTDTYLIRYAFENEVMWKLLNGGNEVVATDTLVYKSSTPTLYGDVKIPLKVKFIADKKIAFTDANLVKNYWYADKDGKMRIVRHNIAVPESGEKDSNKAIFKTSLLNPFTQFRPKLNNDNNAVLNSVKPGLRADIAESNNDNYEFTFYKDQPTLKVGTKNYKLTVSKDGKLLKSDNEVVAKILEDNKLELQNDSEVAKALLNKEDNFLKMRIGIMYYPCGKEKAERAYLVQVNGEDYYTVEFRKPIYMLPNVQDGFRDGVNFGEEGSWIDIAKLANLYDWRNNDKANDDYSFVKYPWFYDYYKVENMEVDKDKIMVNINGKENWEPITLYPQIEFNSYVEQVKANGQVVKVKMKHEDGTEYEQALDKTYAKYGYMTYRNNNNNVKAFSIKFPLTVTYKWGKISTMVEVPVNKTVNSAPTSVR